MKTEKVAVSTGAQAVTPATELVGTMGGMAIVKCTGVSIDGVDIEDGLYLAMGSVLITGPFEWPDEVKDWIGKPENMLATCVKAAAIIKDWDEFRLNGIEKSQR